MVTRGKRVLAALIALLVFVAEAVPLSRTNLLQYADSSGIHPVRSTNDWLLRRASILSAMQEVMGPLTDASRRVPVDPQVEEEVDCGDYLRRRITYASEPGSRVPAYLLVPKRAIGATNTFPAVLALHQTHALGHEVVVGLGNSPDDEYGVELVRRGYVVLAPAYAGLANYRPDLKALGYQSGTMKAIWDNVRGLDLLETLPFVRRGRFGAIGHSLGGHNGLFTAAFEPRLVVVVSSCGFDSFRDYMGGNIAGWTSDRYMPLLKKYDHQTRPFDFPEVLAAIAPRSIFVSAPLHDSNFQARSVDAVAASASVVYNLYRKSAQLVVTHPDCGHQFPKATREAAYAFLGLRL